MVAVTHFMRRPRPNVFSIERLCEDIRDEMPADCDVRVWTCREFSTGILPRLRDMWRACRQQSDVNHITGDVHYLAILLDRRRTILTIHDLVLLERMRGIKRWLIWLFWYWLPVKRSKIITTISDSTRIALLKSLNCDPAKVQVIANPVSNEFSPSRYIFNATCPRILQVGTATNKNLERLSAALSGLSAHLVIVGSLSAKQVELLNYFGISFEWHVGLSRQQIVQEYRRCDMVVFVSSYEGFGLPIIEAQATGRPLITSDILPMSKVAGNGACLVNPTSVSSIREGIVRVINDADYRSQLVESGLQNVKNYRAKSIALQYAELYRQLENL